MNRRRLISSTSELSTEPCLTAHLVRAQTQTSTAWSAVLASRTSPTLPLDRALAAPASKISSMKALLDRALGQDTDTNQRCVVSSTSEQGKSLIQLDRALGLQSNAGAVSASGGGDWGQRWWWEVRRDPDGASDMSQSKTRRGPKSEESQCMDRRAHDPGSALNPAPPYSQYATPQRQRATPWIRALLIGSSSSIISARAVSTLVTSEVKEGRPWLPEVGCMSGVVRVGQDTDTRGVGDGVDVDPRTRNEQEEDGGKEGEVVRREEVIGSAVGDIHGRAVSSRDGQMGRRWEKLAWALRHVLAGRSERRRGLGVPGAGLLPAVYSRRGRGGGWGRIEIVLTIIYIADGGRGAEKGDLAPMKCTRAAKADTRSGGRGVILRKGNIGLPPSNAESPDRRRASRHGLGVQQ
ncbi:hypothetical protein FB45DRAFT_859321 [Roridomyces roridus]|uniref:Uncharacterized protein n=1 Tax=Roridomyces roridus TaxID=1738132 RepID=A0AAD7CJJ5_9AGAR|nr:hypothetical protein FB45DRAFT_859321 [Roridomyces roridus]